MLADTLRVLLMQQLKQADSPLFQVFDRQAVEKIVAIAPRPDVYVHGVLLWFLVQFDTWMRRYRIQLV